MTEETTLLKYELMLILDPDLGEEGTAKQLETIKKYIKSAGGNVVQEDLWGVRDLAYRIAKRDRGYYIVLEVELEGLKITELKKELELEPNLVRFLLIKQPDYYEFTTLESIEAEAPKYMKKSKDDEKAEKEEKEEKKKAPAKPKPEPKPEVKKEEPKVEEESVVEEAKPEPEVEAEPEVEEEPVVEEAKPEPDVEAEPEVEEEPVVEEAKPEPKEEIKLDKSALEDVDAKLKSIIDDPDISL
ncbi:30S ribosomal protein S6 [Candidatus Peregrinibacteria bacterium]|nr:30S ribosomal protein S6 [Candidatus Peregrinibacteria bacterium]